MGFWNNKKLSRKEALLLIQQELMAGIPDDYSNKMTFIQIVMADLEDDTRFKRPSGVGIDIFRHSLQLDISHLVATKKIAHYHRKEVTNKLESYFRNRI